MALAVACSESWGAMSWEQEDKDLGEGVMPEITLGMDDSICVFNLLLFCLHVLYKTVAPSSIEYF